MVKAESGNGGGEGFGGGANPCCRARTEPNMVLITVRNLAQKKCTNLRCPGCHLNFLLIHPRSSFVSRREKTACGRVLSFGPQRVCRCKCLIGWTLRICSLQSMFAESGGGRFRPFHQTQVQKVLVETRRLSMLRA